MKCNACKWYIKEKGFCYAEWKPALLPHEPCMKYELESNKELGAKK